MPIHNNVCGLFLLDFNVSAVARGLCLAAGLLGPESFLSAVHVALVSPMASATSPPPIPCHFGQIVSGSLYLIRLCSQYLCWASWGYAPWRSQYFQLSFVFDFLPLFPSGQLVFSERLSLSWPLLRLYCFLLSTISVCISELFVREAGISIASWMDSCKNACISLSFHIRRL